MRPGTIVKLSSTDRVRLEAVVADRALLRRELPRRHAKPDQPAQSLTTLYVHQNAERFALSPRRATWYPKPAPTFADALARLRRHLWFERIVMPAKSTDMTELIAPELQDVLDAVCYAP